jgi:hypothetical protein
MKYNSRVKNLSINQKNCINNSIRLINSTNNPNTKDKNKDKSKSDLHKSNNSQHNKHNPQNPHNPRNRHKKSTNSQPTPPSPLLSLSLVSNPKNNLPHCPWPHISLKPLYSSPCNNHLLRITYYHNFKTRRKPLLNTHSSTSDSIPYRSSHRIRSMDRRWGKMKSRDMRAMLLVREWNTRDFINLVSMRR